MVRRMLLVLCAGVLALSCVGACAGQPVRRARPQVAADDPRPVIVVLGKRARFEYHQGCETWRGDVKSFLRLSAHVYGAEDGALIACPFRRGCDSEHAPLDVRGERHDEECVDYGACIELDPAEDDESTICSTFFGDR